jgi:hypothetical protein
MGYITLPPPGHFHFSKQFLRFSKDDNLEPKDPGKAQRMAAKKSCRSTAYYSDHEYDSHSKWLLF